jgi:hypothetical protein
MKITKEQLKTEVDNLNRLIESQFKQLETTSHKLMNDGIVNIDYYYDSPIKIMWILKEPYDKNENGQSGGWSITNALDNGALGKAKDSKTWTRIIQSSFCIINNFERFEKVVKLNSKENFREILKKIAFVNVKKIPGNTTTSAKTLNNAYLQNKEILIKQIETYRPDIIIGGKTLHLFKKDLKVEKENELDGGHFFLKNQLFIDTLHPAQRKVSTEDYVNKIVERAEQWKNIYIKKG